MAVPFRRKSNKTKKEGQSTFKHQFRQKSLRQLAKCSNCQAFKIPHQICRNCSTYRNIKY